MPWIRNSGRGLSAKGKAPRVGSSSLGPASSATHRSSQGGGLMEAMTLLEPKETGPVLGELPGQGQQNELGPAGDRDGL